MPDITKCKGEGCKNKEKCYRYTCPASEYQWYFTETPVKEDGTCDELIIREEKDDKRKNTA